jgi:hypothetical protein
MWVPLSIRDVFRIESAVRNIQKGIKFGLPFLVFLRSTAVPEGEKELRPDFLLPRTADARINREKRIAGMVGSDGTKRRRSASKSEEQKTHMA